MSSAVPRSIGIAPFAGVARAPFLLLPVTLVAAGTGAAAVAGQVNWPFAGLALLGMLGVHIAVNALNEASDFKRGIDLETERTPFSGGSGTLPEGRLGYRQAVTTGLVGGAIGIIIGMYFLTVVGWALVPILALGAIAVFAYTDVLARIYVGELFAGLGLGALPVIGTTLVQTGRYEAVAVAASLPAFFMTFNLLLLNEFPDVAPDLKGGRRNLIRLLGRPGAARLYALFAGLVPLSIVAAVVAGYLPLLGVVAVVPSLIFLPRPVGWALRSPQEPLPVPALGANVAWNLSTNTLLAVALGVAASL
ncbi:MAG: prenyltransferase [Gemmatimonadetes bacterium]|uniref:Prenyltransferase n=1 Tax=Candidatus Kutchimonas denitrificans TaxID=3056748 RepID=A0AAE4ZD43_9BACT|nr:prenyltransferase [Gemmatimonadota bacterium]NIR76631.1 prenyltransferase [Candidatus Kutchimonas denitrificans]NIS03400.1 prenyltransferase [Gemmatimonadota bacterium]NIT69261.1 prenyltransferase [Gemmatimonadota bacterium]NIU54733.1 prenyltransferase [Gemmatimonadota bacterium]